MHHPTDRIVHTTPHVKPLTGMKSLFLVMPSYCCVYRENNKIKIWNNGKGIPVIEHKTEKMFVPTMIFGHLLTSSNYDDTERKVTGEKSSYLIHCDTFYFAQVCYFNPCSLCDIINMKIVFKMYLFYLFYLLIYSFIHSFILWVFAYPVPLFPGLAPLFITGYL